MFLISEASSLIIFLEVREKKLARSHHVQSGWVIIPSPFISGWGSAPLSFHSAEQWEQGRPGGLGAPALPRSLSRGRGGWRWSAGWSAGGAPTSPQLGDRELRCMWEKEWAVTVVPRSPIQSRPFRLRACVLPWTLGPLAARPLDSATRVTRAESPPQPRAPSLSCQPAGAERGAVAWERRGAGRSSGPGAPSVAPHLCFSRSSARGPECGS